MNEDLRKFVPNVHFELVPIKDLVSNQEYQRTLSMNHVKKAVEEFDLNQINPIKVSRRDGAYYVFNGQHTAEIVAMASGSRDTPVWCMIYDDLEYVEEADIFANQMKNVKALQPCEIFKANCEAGNDKALIIKGLVESYDLKINSAATPGTIAAVSTLEKIYDRYGYNVLNRVLNLIIITWEGENKSYASNILNGVTRLVVAYEDKLKDEVFKDKLGGMSIKELSRTAKERRAGALGYAEVMLLAYNKRNKAPLIWQKLYSGAGKVIPIDRQEIEPEEERPEKVAEG
ncbi:MAG: hypothetical protein J6N53_13810 [Lachnospiraceae bacterium]|nr:hypothetical protein [Lachnospiraceae bacterium]